MAYLTTNGTWTSGELDDRNETMVACERNPLKGKDACGLADLHIMCVYESLMVASHYDVFAQYVFREKRLCLIKVFSKLIHLECLIGMCLVVKCYLISIYILLIKNIMLCNKMSL